MKKSFCSFEGAHEAQRTINSRFAPITYLPRDGALNFQLFFNCVTIKTLHLCRTTSETGYIARYRIADHRKFELHFVEHGTFSIRMQGYECVLRPGTACLLTATGDVEITASAQARNTAVVIPRNRYAAVAGALGHDPQTALQRYQGLIDVAGNGAEAIFNIANVLLGQQGPDNAFTSAPQGAYLLKEALITTFVQGWPCDMTDQTPKEKADWVILKRAQRWIHDHMGEDFTAEELAKASGMSVRSLQSAFKRHYNTTPFGYIQKLRLQQIHHDLLYSDETANISEIAARSGFAHMSYFASKYRALYGETPSETRNRREKTTTNPEVI